jgi:GH15 family glucan-1,4-alpha-glucosidase
VNEVYYPRLDQACLRDMGLIVTDGLDFFSEEKRHAAARVSYPCAGVPFYRTVNTCNSGRYSIDKEIVTDPHRDVLLQSTIFTAGVGALDDYHLYVLIAPHLANRGAGNTAWIGDYKGVPMLFAQRENCALALACSAPWLKRSAGFVGVSDGWVRHRHRARERGGRRRLLRADRTPRSLRGDLWRSRRRRSRKRSTCHPGSSSTAPDRAHRTCRSSSCRGHRRRSACCPPHRRSHCSRHDPVTLPA